MEGGRGSQLPKNGSLLKGHVRIENHHFNTQVNIAGFCCCDVSCDRYFKGTVPMQHFPGSFSRKNT